MALLETKIRKRLGNAIRILADRLDAPISIEYDSVPVPEQIADLARRIGDEWNDTPYYDRAEADMEWQWRKLLFPLISDCDFSVVVDLAAGHGAFVVDDAVA